MKSILLISSLLVYGSLVNGQESFSIVKPTVDRNTVVTAGAYEVLNAGLTNNTTTLDTLYFKLVSSTNPDGWVFSLCGPQNCFVPGPSSIQGKEVLKVSNRPQLFEVNWSANSPDKGELVYEIYSYKFPLDKKRVTFKMTATTLLSTAEPVSNFSAVYPNPCKDVLTVVTPDNSYKEISITDLSGRVVLQQAVNELTHIVNVSALEKGAYVLTSKGNRLLKKVILVN